MSNSSIHPEDPENQAESRSLEGTSYLTSDTITELVVEEYLSKLPAANAIPLAKVRDLSKTSATETIQFAKIRDEIVFRIRSEIAFRNQKLKPHEARYISQVSKLGEAAVTQLLIHFFHVVRIDLSDGYAQPDLTLLAVYEDSGPREGTYNASESLLRALARQFEPSLTNTAVGSVIQRLGDLAGEVVRTREKHLIAVDNGIFNHSTRELLPFSHEYVFMSKLTTRYNPDAESPVIENPDCSLWEFGSWIHSLTDDPEIVRLFWEVISAALRPYESWNRSVIFAGPKGGGGKGTLLSVMKNLLGVGRFSSISLMGFGERFALAPLLKASVNLVDENDVDAFAGKLGDWKAIVTGDTINFERKGFDPFPMTWKGLDVQCMNTLTPRIKDGSESMKQRLLIVPMTKRFRHTSSEITGIRDDYLKRPEVLEYVLKVALEMQHVKFSVPAVVEAAVTTWFQENNLAVAFWEEYKDQFVWDLLPGQFLYDLFAADLREKYQGSTVPPHNRSSFLSDLRTYLEDSDEWKAIPASGQRPGEMMSEPEPLISAFDLKNWSNKIYTGPNVSRRGVPFPLKAKYYGGLVRKQPRSTNSPVDTTLAAAA